MLLNAQHSPSVRVFQEEGETYVYRTRCWWLHIFFTKHPVQISLFIANNHSLLDAKVPSPRCKIWYLFLGMVLSFSSLSFSRCPIFLVASSSHSFFTVTNLVVLDDVRWSPAAQIKTRKAQQRAILRIQELSCKKKITSASNKQTTIRYNLTTV